MNEARYWAIQWEIAVTDDAERKLLAEQKALRENAWPEPEGEI